MGLLSFIFHDGCCSRKVNVSLLSIKENKNIDLVAFITEIINVFVKYIENKFAHQIENLVGIYRGIIVKN